MADGLPPDDAVTSMMDAELKSVEDECGSSRPKFLENGGTWIEVTNERTLKFYDGETEYVVASIDKAENKVIIDDEAARKMIEWQLEFQS